MSAIARIGNAIQRHPGAVAAAQWAMVAAYVALVLLPATPWGAGLAGAAELLFWGLWWPGVVLSMLLLGQFWCGLLCPDGTLTEFASRRGLGRKVPDWMRWPALPAAAFAAVTLYDHLIDAHRAPRAAALLIGGTTLAAVAVGAVYGKGKRVWCRYLCPISGLFSILARAAVLHIRVDRARWDAAPRRGAGAVDCPPLLDVRRLLSNEKCNMCCRCCGHRGAVALAARAPGAELSALPDDEVRIWEAAAIVALLGGLLVAVGQWQGSWWHAAIAAAVAAPGDAAPWWLSGSADGPRTWGEAAALALALLAGAAVLALAQSLALLAGARGRLRDAARLAYALIPVAGLGLLLASLEHALALAAARGWASTAAVPALRWTLLGVGWAWTVRLAWGLAGRRAWPAAWTALAAAAVAAAYLLAPLPGR